jgi:hypothetical protein
MMRCLVASEIADVATPLGHPAAERLDKRIRLLAGQVRENMAKIGDLVAEAKAGQIHLTLGFNSWTAYLADALGGQLELNTETRREVVELMAGEGMSQRAIAQATGASKTTIQRDIAGLQEGQVVQTGPPGAVTGLDGKTYTKSRPEPPEDDTAAAPSEGTTDDAYFADLLSADRRHAAARAFDDRHSTFRWNNGVIVPTQVVLPLQWKLRRYFTLEKIGEMLSERGDVVIAELTELVSLHAALRRASRALKEVLGVGEAADADDFGDVRREVIRECSDLRGCLDDIEQRWGACDAHLAHRDRPESTCLPTV